MKGLWTERYRRNAYAQEVQDEAKHFLRVLLAPLQEAEKQKMVIKNASNPAGERSDSSVLE